MSEYIKYFDDGGKNMSFKIEEDNIYLPYIEIWSKIKRASNIRSHSQYIKPKVKTFNGVINTVFSDNNVIKKIHYICIAAICIDSILKIDKKTILKLIWNNVNLCIKVFVILLQ